MYTCIYYIHLGTFLAKLSSRIQGTVKLDIMSEMQLVCDTDSVILSISSIERAGELLLDFTEGKRDGEVPVLASSAYMGKHL